MGRKSALTDDQWTEIERRILLDNEPVYKLAIEYGVNESSIRRRIKPNKAEKADKAEVGLKSVPELKKIANRKVAADAESRAVTEVIASLPYAHQNVVMTLAEKLSRIGDHLASAAEYGAATAHRLNGIAHDQVGKIDDAEPERSMESLQRIAVLSKIANSSAEIGLKLLAANKDIATPDETPPTPTAINFVVKSARKQDA